MVQGVPLPILLHLTRLFWVACVLERVQIDFTICAREEKFRVPGWDGTHLK